MDHPQPARKTSYRIPLVLVRLAIVGPMCGLIALDAGFRREFMPGRWLHICQLVLFGIYVVYAVWRLRAVARWLDKLRRAWFDWLLIAVGVVDLATSMLSGVDPLAGWSWWIMDLAFVGMLLWQGVRLYVALTERYYTAPALLPGSFAMIIALGALLLKLPVAVPADAPSLSWLDSLFTATSAVCVTGLIVRDTATQFTVFGQTVLLVLIQFGALGVGVVGTLMAMMLRGRLSLREAASVSGAIGQSSLHRVRRMVVFIMGLTLLVELLGAAALAGLWGKPIGPNEGTFDAVFHAISAFCNAGFSTYTDSLMAWRGDPAVLGVVGVLIVVGGLGFPVLFNLAEVVTGKMRWLRSGERRAPVRLTLHSRIVLHATAWLLVGGAVLLFVSQMLAAGTTEGAGGHALDAAFQSITARTAGFNSMPMDELSPASRFVLMGLMFIGGSPASTAGGIKTVVLMVLLMAAVATARGRSEPEAFGRSIVLVQVRRAVTVVLAMGSMVAAATMLLCLTQPGASMEMALFEVVSAAGTVGLSLGLTPELTGVGRVVIIVCMFAGRVGPLTLIASLALRRIKWAERSYPTEMVVLG